MCNEVWKLTLEVSSNLTITVLGLVRNYCCGGKSYERMEEEFRNISHFVGGPLCRSRALNTGPLSVAC